MTGMEGGQRPRTSVADGGPPWRPARFASFVVEELAEAIVSGALAEGDVLPTEPALCAQFGFSRTVVREGLKMLEERGLVRVEQGRGTTVQPRSAWNLLDPVVLRIGLAHDHDMSLLDDLIAVRVVLEREMATAAAGRLTQDELAALAENEVGLTIVRAIHRHGGITPLLAAGSSREVLAQTAREHRDIYDALAAGDGALAGDRIAMHIESAWAERKVSQRS
jgi:DNA-binding FadR family transcriptional regulator